MGVGAALTAMYWTIRERSKKLGLIVFAFLIFFVSWAVSPRIMFYYHFLPSTAFLTIILGYVATRTKLTKYMLLVALIVFIYFYPHWTGLQIPQSLDNSYYWLESWR
jgi:dolichyl-phosphate-mannose--protein O-mannosyl transferase